MVTAVAAIAEQHRIGAFLAAADSAAVERVVLGPSLHGRSKPSHRVVGLQTIQQIPSVDVACRLLPAPLVAIGACVAITAIAAAAFAFSLATLAASLRASPKATAIAFTATARVAASLAAPVAAARAAARVPEVAICILAVGGILRSQKAGDGTEGRGVAHRGGAQQVEADAAVLHRFPAAARPRRHPTRGTQAARKGRWCAEDLQRAIARRVDDAAVLGQVGPEREHRRPRLKQTVEYHVLERHRSRLGRLALLEARVGLGLARPALRPAVEPLERALRLRRVVRVELVGLGVHELREVQVGGLDNLRKVALERQHAVRAAQVVVGADEGVAQRVNLARPPDARERQVLLKSQHVEAHRCIAAVVVQRRQRRLLPPVHQPRLLEALDGTAQVGVDGGVGRRGRGAPDKHVAPIGLRLARVREQRQHRLEAIAELRPKRRLLPARLWCLCLGKELRQWRRRRGLLRVTKSRTTLRVEAQFQATKLAFLLERLGSL
eukprot:6206048-Pleurochrysis_carterae.AAC.5